MCRATYQLVGEHALHAAIEASGAHGSRCGWLRACWRPTAKWGGSGLVNRLADGMLVLQGFEDGEAFVIWAARPFAGIGIATNAAAAAQGMGRADPRRGCRPAGSCQRSAGQASCPGCTPCWGSRPPTARST
ncbi:MAG: hypothetical protein U0Z44_12035 [Kouleothrix sp.]